MLEQLQLQTWSKKRMILVILLLAVLTILLLILEEALTSQGEYKPTSTPKSLELLDRKENNNANPVVNPASDVDSHVNPVIPNTDQPCWITESFSVEKSCSPCTDFELNSKSPVACMETGLKETIRCVTSGIVYRSCSRLPDVEKRNFLVFESVMLLVAIVAYGIVRFRTSQLERIAARKMQKSLEHGL